MLHGKLGEALFCAAFGRPLVQQFLSLDAAQIPLCHCVDGFPVFTGCAAFWAQQNVTHIHSHTAVFSDPLGIECFLIFRIVTFDLSHIRDQAVIDGIQILAGIDVGMQVLHVAGFIAGCAHIVFQHGSYRIIAIGGCHFLDLIRQAFHIGLHFFTQLEMIFLCLHIQRRISAPGVDCAVQEELLPGNACFLILELLVQRLGKVQHGTVQIIAIITLVLIDCLPVVDLQGAIGQFHIANSGNHGIPFLDSLTVRNTVAACRRSRRLDTKDNGSAQHRSNSNGAHDSQHDQPLGMFFLGRFLRFFGSHFLGHLCGFLGHFCAFLGHLCDFLGHLSGFLSHIRNLFGGFHRSFRQILQILFTAGRTKGNTLFHFRIAEFTIHRKILFS